MAASLECSEVFPSHFVRALNCAADSLVRLFLGAIIRYCRPCSLHQPSQIDASRQTLPAPFRRSRPVLPNHLRWRASSMNSRILSLPRMSEIIFTRSIAWVIVMVLTSARYFVSECHTAKPVCTPVSMPMYVIVRSDRKSTRLNSSH